MQATTRSEILQRVILCDIFGRMSEFKRPEQLIAEALAAIQGQAKEEQKRVDFLTKEDPKSLKVHYSDAATHKRMAGVYEQTAQSLDKISTSHKRNLVKALAKHYENLSNEELDKIATELNIA